MKEIQYIRCPCCGKMSRAKNFNLDMIHDFGIWVSRVGGRASIQWFKRVLTEVEWEYLKEKFALHLERIYIRLTGKRFDGSGAIDLKIQDVSVGDEKLAFGIREPSLRTQQFNLNTLGGVNSWYGKKGVETLSARNIRDAIS